MRRQLWVKQGAAKHGRDEMTFKREKTTTQLKTSWWHVLNAVGAVCCLHKVPSLSQQHRHGSHKIQVHTNQHPQVPMFSLMPCPVLLKTVSTHVTPDETHSVATKHVFQQHCVSPVRLLLRPNVLLRAPLLDLVTAE